MECIEGGMTGKVREVLSHDTLLMIHLVYFSFPSRENERHVCTHRHLHSYTHTHTHTHTHTANAQSLSSVIILGVPPWLPLNSSSRPDIYRGKNTQLIPSRQAGTLWLQIWAADELKPHCQALHVPVAVFHHA